MQPIIRRTITITIIETWTITWPDGQETTWQATEEVLWPAAGEPMELPPALTDDADRDHCLAADDDAAQTTAAV